MTTLRRDATNGNDQLVIQGILTELDPSRTLDLNGKTYSPASLAALIQRRVDLFLAIGQAKAQWLDQIAQYEALSKELTIVLGQLRIAVFGIFGQESEKVAAFGFAPPRKGVRTQEQKLAAAAKARATRKARGTKGKRAPLAIKGTVPAVVPGGGDPAAKP